MEVMFNEKEAACEASEFRSVPIAKILFFLFEFFSFFFYFFIKTLLLLIGDHWNRGPDQ